MKLTKVMNYKKIIMGKKETIIIFLIRVK